MLFRSGFGEKSLADFLNVVVSDNSRGGEILDAVEEARRDFCVGEWLLCLLTTVEHNFEDTTWVVEIEGHDVLMFFVFLKVFLIKHCKECNEFIPIRIFKIFFYCFCCRFLLKRKNRNRKEEIDNILFMHLFIYSRKFHNEFQKIQNHKYKHHY